MNIRTPILSMIAFLWMVNGSAQISISIHASDKVMNQVVDSITITDVLILLSSACDCKVDLNNDNASIQVLLSEPDTEPFTTIKHLYNKDSVPSFYYPPTHFKWSSSKEGEVIQLQLDSPSFEGISAGLYALLQEKLGFRFYHPREQVIPSWREWPLANNWEWSAKERFNKRGFHLHTMHPLELTEALLDENFPNGMAHIKEYIDWLVRNGQNYFEFNLLNTVDMKNWIPYISELVDYAHDRGLIMGLDISLNMIQQKAFKLYKRFPSSFKRKKKQIIHNLDVLAEANFDVYNIEMSSTEYSSGNSEKRHKRMQLILDWARTEEAKIMGRAHVVKKGEAVLNYTGDDQAVYDSERGVMIHTVMFYEINDEKAPVYGNSDLKHMYSLLQKEQQQRETWYFPESAYWITFDNSVPMLLLPYLSARSKDILDMEKNGIEGHLTFSSGWEWGYWIIDWCIARWSWDYDKDINAIEGISLLVDEDITNVMSALHDLQDEYFKDKELMRYLVAQTVLDEVPKKFSKEFQPRPRWRYPYLFNKSTAEELDSFYQEGILPLEEFVEKHDLLMQDFYTATAEKENPIINEWRESLDITGLRAKHRHSILMSIYTHRKQQLEKIKGNTYLIHLDAATTQRKLAQKIVDNRIQHYRYDPQLLSSKRKGHTAYHFGYLYPVSELHFWKREEEQVRRNKWGFPFMNIWNIWRIMGII
jgi:hypothetical protein